MGSSLAAHRKASRTAYDCAAVRAAVHAWTGCTAFDYLAHHFVRGPSASLRAKIGVHLARAGAASLTQWLITHTSPGAEVLLFARQAVPDGMIRAALSENPRTQIVILGTGLDTCGLRIGAERRRAGEAPGDFCEIDLPETLAEKQRLVARVQSLLPGHSADHIRYLPCTFGENELPAVLLAAGFDCTRPSVWVWSGVIHYLSEAAVRATLSQLKSLSAPGSLLFFDCVARAAYESPDAYAFASTKARFDAFGEVMHFGLPEEEEQVREWLAAQGLRLLRRYTHLDMVQVYEQVTGTRSPSKGAAWASLCIASF